ncbi:MAG TPA: AAC(3) family N-acetyltransferase [Bacillota bacterium]
MGEAETIANTCMDTNPMVRTRQSLAGDLYRLGLRPGMTVLVHSSLSSLGWVCGGPVAIVQALCDAITSAGTLVMPAHSGDYSDPCYWQNPPVPKEWWQTIRETMPAYEPEITPTRGMGAIPETFRTFPGVLRSSHPALSFTAWGKDAAVITRGHTLDNALGEGSPLARIYERDGWVLLLGVGYENNTSFHLAEYRIPVRAPFDAGAPVLEAGQRVWKRYKDIEFHMEFFAELGREFEARESVSHPVIQGKVGSAAARLFPQRAAVDFAAEWLKDKYESS